MDATHYVDPTINRPTVEFTIPGEPVSKARHKTGVRGGKVHHYKDTKNAHAQDRVGVYYRQQRGPGEPGEGGFGVKAAFYVKSRQRRDIDNFLKLVFDGLTGFAWIDDSQVTEVSARIIHGDDNPRSVIKVYPTNDLPDRLSRGCELCGETFRTYESWSSRKYCSADCRDGARRLKNTRKCQQCHREYQSSAKSKFCSQLCRTEHQSKVIECDHCHSIKRVARAKAQNGRKHFCDSECQAAYWREHRAAAAKGRCMDCGETTSKRTYQRCRPCAIEAMRSS